jgi:small subunit ribosomal protein S5
MAREIKQKEDEIIEKLVNIRRVTKVTKGGKNMRFAALVVVGDGKGRVGFATAKAREVPDAVKKAVERARRAMIRIPLREGRTVHHDTVGNFGASKVYIRTASSGTGIIAGGAMRSVFEAVGIHDIVSKSVGTSNYHNVVRATFDALQSIASPRSVAAKLGRRVSEIIARREGKQHQEEENV